MFVSENDQLKIMRQGLDSTKTYNLDMSRAFMVDYKISDNLSSRYTLNIGSDLYHDMEKYNWTKQDMFSELNTGLIKVIKESFKNTYTPNLFYWLKPTFSYNPSYDWNLGNPSDDILTSTIKNSTNFETKSSKCADSLH